MGKIPVGDTISAAYNFAFARILTVLGIFWFPCLILAVIVAGSIYLLAPELPHQLVNGPWDLSLALYARRISGIINLALIVVTAMIAVGLQRRALGLDEGPAFFYFSLGSAVWRMIGAFFLAIVLAVVMVMVTAGVCVAIWFAAGHIPQYAATVTVRTISIIAGICWYIYFLVRLTFFLPPAVVADGGIGLARSWTLGRGNFWRIIGVWIVIYVPVMIGFGMVQQAFLGPFLPDFHFDASQNVDPEALLKMFVKGFRVIGPIYLVLVTIEQLIFAGLGNGACAAAYRFVTRADSSGMKG